MLKDINASASLSSHVSTFKNEPGNQIEHEKIDSQKSPLISALKLPLHKLAGKSPPMNSPAYTEINHHNRAFYLVIS
ncbi:hypothetical protein CN481_04890 [Bacillus sp. AFS006103]|nr:hypothetical protein CN481_04890 [Bacillus sp. AFS006103]